MPGNCCIDLCQREENEGDYIDCRINQREDEEIGVKKRFVTKLIDVALLAANASQLKTLLNADSSQKFYYPILALILSSMFFHIFYCFVQLALIKIGTECDICKAKRRVTNSDGDSISNASTVSNESVALNGQNNTRDNKSTGSNRRQKHRCCSKAEENLEIISIVLLVIITIVNIFITSFSFNPKSESCKN